MQFDRCGVYKEHVFGLLFRSTCIIKHMCPTNGCTTFLIQKFPSLNAKKIKHCRLTEMQTMNAFTGVSSARRMSNNRWWQIRINASILLKHCQYCFVHMKSSGNKSFYSLFSLLKKNKHRLSTMKHIFDFLNALCNTIFWT